VPLLLHHSRDLPAPGAYDTWFAITATPADGLDPKKRLPDLGRRLEQAFDAIAEDWWRLGKALGANPSAHWAHAPTAAAYNSDLGLMMAWSHLAADVAGESRALAVCDDPWLFRHLSDLPGCHAGRPAGMFGAMLRLWARGHLARLRVAARVAMAAWRTRHQRQAFGRGDPMIQVYGHPASTADGFDAYFGNLMAVVPSLRRLLHTDTPPARAVSLAKDGRTASLHAWGNVWFALRLVFTRWRPSASEIQGPWGWLVRRAAAHEGGGGAAAMNRWQMHCQDRWLAAARPTVVAWPWENHPWERAFCRTARRLGVATVGYQHAVVGPHQLNAAPATNSDGLDSLPDRILCSGPAYRDQLRRWGIPDDQLSVGGAFRIQRFDGERYDPKGPVYVPLSAIGPIADQMLDAVGKARRPGRRFLIKDHPLYPHPIIESEDIRRTDRTLPEQQGLSAVFFATGTPGLEAMLAGVPTIRLLPEDRIAPDVLPDGLSARSVTVDGFGAALDHPPPPPSVPWDSVYADVDMDVWRTVFESTE